MSPSGDDRMRAAEEAYAAFLEAREDGGESFSAFCAARPELADELRRIRAAHGWADGLLPREVDGAEADGTGGDGAADGAPARASRSADERYEILREVARGGMGIVLEVFDRELRRPLAMKVLQPDGNASRRAVARFLEEAQVTGQLEHPSIVPIHDVGALAGNRVYFTMPLVRGRDLEEVFALAREGRDGFNTTRVLGILLRVAEAVGAAHGRGVVHRDLKPANVMVGVYGEVYVMDWGLARILEGSAAAGGAALGSDRRELLARSPDSSIGTIDGQVLGTPSFMSPEQARGDFAAVGPASDVYSLGAMLYYLATGSRAYDAPGERLGTAEVLERLLQGPPPPVHVRAPDAPAELAAICDRAMAREPAQRYADMNELAADLRAFLERRVVSAYRTGALAELRMWVRRNRPLAAAIGSLFATAVVALGVTASLRADSEQQARRATAHFESALGAIDRALTRVGEDELRDVPGAQAARRELLEDARDLYEDLLAERGDDPEVRWRVARAHARLADVYYELNDNDAARAMQHAALEQLRAIQADDPDDPRVERVIAFELHELAKAHFRNYSDEEGRAHVAEALERVEALLEEHPRDEELLRHHASMLGSAGVLRLRADPEDAEPWLRRAVEACEAYLESPLATDEGGAFARRKLRENATNLAIVCMITGRPEEAWPVAERMVELTEEDLAADPGNRTLRTQLANSLSTLAVARAQSEPGSDEARRLAERVLAIHQELYADFPGVVDYAREVAGDYSNLALIVSDGGDHAAALELVEDAVRWSRRALVTAPDEEALKRDVDDQYQNLFWILNLAGDHATIAARVPEVISIDPDRALPYRRTAATALAYCATIVAEDEELAPEERERLRDGYVAEMVRCFEEMAELGEAAPEELDGSAFEPLRDDPRVVELRRTLEGRAAGPR